MVLVVAHETKLERVTVACEAKAVEAEAVSQLDGTCRPNVLNTFRLVFTSNGLGAMRKPAPLGDTGTREHAADTLRDMTVLGAGVSICALLNAIDAQRQGPSRQHACSQRPLNLQGHLVIRSPSPEPAALSQLLAN